MITVTDLPDGEKLLVNEEGVKWYRPKNLAFSMAQLEVGDTPRPKKDKGDHDASN